MTTKRIRNHEWFTPTRIPKTRTSGSEREPVIGYPWSHSIAGT